MPHRFLCGIFFCMKGVDTMTTVTVTEQISVITFGNVPFEDESGFIFRIFENAAAEKISIDMISKASVSTDRTSVGFTFSDNDMPRMLNVLSRIKFYRPPLVSCGNVKIVIKSREMENGIGFARDVFSILDSISVTPILITTSVDEISVVVRASDSTEVVRSFKEKADIIEPS